MLPNHVLLFIEVDLSQLIVNYTFFSPHYQIDELSLSLESNLLALEEGKKLIMEREDELKKSR